MQYNPKLKQAMEEIKKIIKENDIAAFVLLHTPGHSEFLNAVSTSYSCAKIEDGEIKFRIKTAEVGKEKAKALAEGTYNMITHFRDQLTIHASLYIDAYEFLKDHWGGEDDKGSVSSHTQQNN
jgi:hypothetical protein